MHCSYVSARFAIPGVLGLLLILAPQARAEGWGTIKGQVVWAGGAIPERQKLKVDKDQEACLKNGPLLEEKYVVNPKNKGVRWVLVWLADANPKTPTKAIPIHPSLAKPKKDVVELDQPCCMFEPHVSGVREGQTLVVKNSAKITHNVNVQGGIQGPSVNPILPPGGELKLTDLKARKIPISISCNIHGWMKGWVGVFKNPYFAVTDENGNFEIKDAPAGQYRLYGWQEETGYVLGRNGKLIDIKPNAVTQEKIELQPSK